MATNSVVREPAHRTINRTRVAVSVGIGNALEFFDFTMYGFFAVIIGQVFFASDSPVVGTLSALAVFGVSFFARPLGGFIFGPIGDRYGRKVSLIASVLLMGFSTAFIGLLPTYEAIGVAAPILLVLLRLIQGISTGGESGGAITYMNEMSPADRRGLYSSVVPATGMGTVGIASLVALSIQLSLPEDALLAWGWRLPFLIAAPLSVIGLYIRFKLDESPVFEAMKASGQATLGNANPRRWGGKNIVFAFFVSGMAGVGSYYLATYMITHLTTTAGFDRTPALIIVSVGMLLGGAICCPLAGALSDRIGRRPTMVIGLVGWLVLIIPVLLLMNTGALVWAIIGFALLAISHSMVQTTTYVSIAEAFPGSSRSSAVGITFNTAQALIAGPGPLVAAALVAGTGIALAASWYLIAVAAVTLVIVLVLMPETRGKVLS
ncbi:MFS transporter [Microbacterium sp. zg.B48]|uniref:MFS transporter n=1 Tax=Microbacterium sp. zg.B48 TaxID=2969408 RepID=UPI00214C61F9|nr:MFS transporter [Microbacterium sp. zg.B48]MCR2765010.1 MFS transporter [Microbacterium sp. zg.B48]